MNKPPVTFDEVIKLLELDEVTFTDDEWVEMSRESLYRAAITVLVEFALADGFRVVLTSNVYPVVCEVTPAPEEEYETDPCTICEGSGTLDDGSICQFCAGYGNRIIDDDNPAALMPDDPESL